MKGNYSLKLNAQFIFFAFEEFDGIVSFSYGAGKIQIFD